MQKSFILLPTIWGRVLVLSKRYPRIISPFIWSAAVNFALLCLLFLAPRFPLSVVFDPLIRAFWGEQYLHYPMNFMLLPKLLHYGMNAMVFFVGVVFTGVGVSMVAQGFQGAQPQWWPALQKALKKYIRLAGIWAVILIGVFGLQKLVQYCSPFISSRKILTGLELSEGIIIQIMFVFSIPAVIIENRKLFPSLLRSISIVKDNLIDAFLLVILPSLLFIPLIYIDVRVPDLMNRFFPEIMLYVLVLRITVLTIIDFLITSSATMLLLLQREKESRESTT